MKDVSLSKSASPKRVEERDAGVALCPVLTEGEAEREVLGKTVAQRIFSQRVFTFEQSFCLERSVASQSANRSLHRVFWLAFRNFLLPTPER